MYKTGALDEMASEFKGHELTLEDFKAAFGTHVMTTFEGAWALQAESEKYGYGTIGAQFGFWHHPKFGVYMNGGGLIWVPYATPRMKLETMVNFFDKIRREFPFVAFCRAKHRRFFEAISRHHVLRCIGESQNFGMEPMYMFETRRLK